MTDFKTYYKEAINTRLDPSKGEWYHGDQNQRSNFKNQNMDRDHTIQSANEHGPGIYLTRKYSEAMSYAHPNGYVYTIVIKPENKIIKDRMKTNQNYIKKLIDWCPEDRKIVGLSNWDEDPNVALSKAIKTYSNYDLLESCLAVYYDFYGHTEANDWTNSMMNLGIDAYWRFLNETEHLIVYNPSIIHIIKEEDYSDAYSKLHGEE